MRRRRTYGCEAAPGVRPFYGKRVWILKAVYSGEGAGTIHLVKKIIDIFLDNVIKYTYDDVVPKHGR